MTRVRPLLLLVSCSLVLWELLLTRIYSTILYYHFAFMAVSTAMLGMTLGAVWTALRPVDDVPRRLHTLALVTGLSMAAAIAAQLALPLRFENGGPPPLYLVSTYALSSLPFVPGGALVCLSLTRFPGVAGLYAADLVGAALGCAAFPAVVVAFGAPGAVLVAGALAALGAALVDTARARALVGALTALALLGIAVANESARFLRVRYSHFGPAHASLHESWNAFSRITVFPITGPAFGWGIDSSFALPVVDELFLEIDSGAGTPLMRFDGDVRPLDFLRLDITGFAHELRKGDVCIIGPGGGRDILTALVHEQHHVTAIEVNPDILDAVNGKFGEWTGHLDARPDVTFVVDDGRSYLERERPGCDILQASLVDTVAATAAGAYAFSENGLYTVEAWRLFLDRLTPQGVLTFSRFYHGSTTWPVEVYRTVALGAAALRAAGVADPRAHLLLIRNALRADDRRDGLATILVSRAPFTAADIARAHDVCATLKCEVALEPGASLDPELDFVARAAPEEIAVHFPLDVTAPHDDRPFFFFHARLSDLFAGRAGAAVGGSAFNMPAVRMLVVLTAVVSVVGGLLVLVPALWQRRLHRGRSRALPAYFACIGLAFMGTEIGLIQRLSLFLGHPIYGFTVVLFGLLLFGGLGSVSSTRLIARLGPRRVLALVVAATAAVELVSALVQNAAMGEPTPVRIALALVELAPAAFFMGTCFPVGMHEAERTADPRTAWLWAVNGACSVTGSVLAMLCAVEAGITATLWVGVALYGAAALLVGRARLVKDTPSG